MDRRTAGLKLEEWEWQDVERALEEVSRSSIEEVWGSCEGEECDADVIVGFDLTSPTRYYLRQAVARIVEIVDNSRARATLPPSPPSQSPKEPPSPCLPDSLQV